MDVSSVILLGVIVFAFGYAAYKRVDIVSAFCEGARENLKVALDLLPTLCLLMLAVSMLRASGVLDWLTGILTPLAVKLGFPAECLPLAILRPISGSGAIALLEDALRQCGPDSFPGRVASTLCASSETTFYTVAVYFAAVKSKKPKAALISALAGDLAAFVFSAVAVRIMFG